MEGELEAALLLVSVTNCGSSKCLNIFFLFFQATHMADFSHIQSIQTVLQTPSSPSSSSQQTESDPSSKACLQLKVAGSSELLTVTCPSLAMAENMADLIDGYCRVVNDSANSLWTRRGERTSLFTFVLQSCEKHLLTFFCCNYHSAYYFFGVSNSKRELCLALSDLTS